MLSWFGWAGLLGCEVSPPHPHTHTAVFPRSQIYPTSPFSSTTFFVHIRKFTFIQHRFFWYQIAISSISQMYPTSRLFPATFFVHIKKTYLSKIAVCFPDRRFYSKITKLSNISVFHINVFLIRITNITNLSNIAVIPLYGLFPLNKC